MSCIDVVVRVLDEQKIHEKGNLIETDVSCLYCREEEIRWILVWDKKMMYSS